jgi:hypothetical protein
MAPMACSDAGIIGQYKKRRKVVKILTDLHPDNLNFINMFSLK